MILFGRKKKENDRKNIALFVDGPNIIRREFGVDLDELRKLVEKHGRLMVGKVFLNQYASEKLIEAISNQGFKPEIILAGESSGDVDVAVAVSAVQAAYHPNIDVVAIASRDADYLPVVQVVKELGKKTIIIGADPGFSKALQHAADAVEFLSPKGRLPPPSPKK